MNKPDHTKPPLSTLHYHTSGAVERGEAEPIVGIPTERMFPIQGSWQDRTYVQAYGIPWEMIAPHEAQALHNHCRQSLETLARRGGLSDCEAIAVLQGRHWHMMHIANAREELLKMVEEWRAGQPTEIDTKVRLDPFHRAYIQTALWSSVDALEEPLDKHYDEESFGLEALQRIVVDCDTFRAQAGAIIAAAIEKGVKCGPDFDAWGRAAHDFWLTRNGHGAGFWDGDWPEPEATKLSEIARAFGTCDLYVCEEGNIHIA